MKKRYLTFCVVQSCWDLLASRAYNGECFGTNTVSWDGKGFSFIIGHLIFLPFISERRCGPGHGALN